MTMSKLRTISSKTFNNSTFEERVENLIHMDTELYEYGDEDLIDIWLAYGVPDCPSQEDLEYIANDKNLYTDCINLFEKLCSEMN